jgi:hypothetical protein
LHRETKRMFFRSRKKATNNYTRTATKYLNNRF